MKFKISDKLNKLLINCIDAMDERNEHNEAYIDPSIALCKPLNLFALDYFEADISKIEEFCGMAIDSVNQSKDMYCLNIDDGILYFTLGTEEEIEQKMKNYLSLGAFI